MLDLAIYSSSFQYDCHLKRQKRMFHGIEGSTVVSGIESLQLWIGLGEDENSFRGLGLWVQHEKGESTQEGTNTTMAQFTILKTATCPQVYYSESVESEICAI